MKFISKIRVKSAYRFLARVSDQLRYLKIHEDNFSIFSDERYYYMGMLEGIEVSLWLLGFVKLNKGRNIN